jgi:hypothetical protein
VPIFKNYACAKPVVPGIAENAAFAPGKQNFVLQAEGGPTGLSTVKGVGSL